MKHIGSQVKRVLIKTRQTERGELLRYFCRRVNIDRMRDNYPNIPIARMGKILQDVPTKDLYYLRRVCDEAPNFSKKFWWEVDPKKHEEK